jgi:hypothetical protein
MSDQAPEILLAHHLKALKLPTCLREHHKLARQCAAEGVDRPDGTRRFRRAYIEEGKGNGKSPFAGGVGLYGMMADNEPGAEIYAVAAHRDQAKILFNDAVAMVDQSPDLAKRITQSGGPGRVFNMAWLAKGSFFRPLSRSAGKSGSGLRPHIGLADELHEHPNRDAVEMIERGFKFRLQPLLLMITNSGTDRNSICYEEHEHAVRVAAGTATPGEDFAYVGEVIDDTTFSFVCSLDPGDDPLNDPSCWAKANPLLGTILSHDYLEGVVAQAKAIPGKLNGILRLHFCQWTDAEAAWMSRAVLELERIKAETAASLEGVIDAAKGYAGGSSTSSASATASSAIDAATSATAGTSSTSGSNDNVSELRALRTEVAQLARGERLDPAPGAHRLRTPWDQASRQYRQTRGSCQGSRGGTAVKWLSNLITPFKSELLAMVGVLAICGIGATIAAYLHIQRQNDQIATLDTRVGDLVSANRGWADRYAEQDRLRALEQKNVLLLQDKLALIEQQGVASSAQIKELEKSNAEVRELMARRLPPDLRRLLEQQR